MMLVTKYCSPKFKDLMARGCFKIGSHEEYSNGKETGALSDIAEGNGGFSVNGSLINSSFSIGSNVFTNCSFEAPAGGKSLIYQSKINTLMFCAYKGNYNLSHHCAYIEGDPVQAYRANPDSTSYLILDVTKLKAALTAATDQFFGITTRWIGAPVQYGERYDLLEAKNFKGFTDFELIERITKQAMLKPKKFAIEEEFRFIMVTLPKQPLPKVILTKDLSMRIHKVFRRAVIDSGDIRSTNKI